MEPCCEPVTRSPLDKGSAATMASRLKALADPTRLRLFSMIASTPDRCACDFSEPLGVSQPTVSHHLKQLTEAGLITRTQRGKWAYFAVDSDALAELSAFLDPAAFGAGAAEDDFDLSAARG